MVDEYAAVHLMLTVLKENQSVYLLALYYHFKLGPTIINNVVVGSLPALFGNH